MENPFYQKPKKDVREPRTNIREEIRATVRYRGPSKEVEIQVQALVANISEKGAFFSTSRESIPPDTEVCVTFRLPGLGNEIPLSIVGKTRRTQRLEGEAWGTGIEFTEVSESNLKAIRNLISQQQLGETF